MEPLSLLLIFWYGVLHAFGPDHLSVIADFSLGKSKKKTFLITILFALGHGLMLFVFAKLLQSINISPSITNFGDIISASVIILMGVYFLYKVFTKQIQLTQHYHKGVQHTHIYFGKEHEHDDERNNSSVFTLGALMGMGGVRGMLITLSAVQNSEVTLMMVLFFTLGVVLVFLCFGLLISTLNQYILTSTRNVRSAFAIAGFASVLIGTSILF